MCLLALRPSGWGLNGGLDVAGWAGLLGRRSSYMPSKVETRGDGEMAGSRLLSYTYDTDEYGRIVKITEYAGGYRVVYDITYSE